MPNYNYYCPKCERKQSITKPMEDYDSLELCDNCHIEMERDYNRCGFHCGNKEYGSPLISESLGIHPDQTEEHRKNHPNVGVMPEGQLRFDNYQDHNNYLKKIGWNKQEGRKKKRVGK